MTNVLDDNRMSAVMLGGVLMLFAAIFSLRINESKELDNKEQISDVLDQVGSNEL